MVKYVLTTLLIFAVLTTACEDVADRTAETGDFGHEVAVEWMDLLSDAVRSEGYSPPVASRIYAYSCIALYESLVPGMPEYVSLSSQLNDMPVMPLPELSLTYDWPSSASAALETVAQEMFESASTETVTAIQQLGDVHLESRRTDGVPEEIIGRSVEYGQSVGDTILAWASVDGYQETLGLAYTPPTGTDKWIPTLPGFAPALEPYWGHLRPFAVQAGDVCKPPPPVQYSEDTGSEFYREVLSVYEAVNNLTEEQRLIAEFWADSPAMTSTPPGHWLQITTQIVEKNDMRLDEAAEIYALVGIAVGDSFISCWDEKYRSNLLRPITYIRDHIDADWETAVNTPPFPEYVSGHSVVSGSVASVLTHMLGTVPFTDDSHEVLGFSPRTFESFEEAAEEAAISRLYGGIHYPMAVDNGLIQGQCIGQQIIERVKTRR